MTQAISSANIGGFVAELATLLLENEAAQSDSSRMQRDAARQNYLEQSQQQVEALHAAADATRIGAFVSASFTVAGGACQIAGASLRINAAVGPQRPCADLAANARAVTIFRDIGTTSSKLGDPLSTFIGESSAAHRQAEAKQHELFAARAQWQASDASAEIDKANKQADKVLDLTEDIQRQEDAATNALIGRI